MENENLRIVSPLYSVVERRVGREVWHLVMRGQKVVQAFQFAIDAVRTTNLMVMGAEAFPQATVARPSRYAGWVFEGEDTYLTEVEFKERRKRA